MILIFIVLANFIFQFFILYYPTRVVLIVQLFKFNDLPKLISLRTFTFTYTQTYMYTHICTYTLV